MESKVTTNFTIPKESELNEAAERLLEAAYAYWKIHQRECGTSAVVWLKDDNGHTVIFTRGEYVDAMADKVFGQYERAPWQITRTFEERDPEGAAYAKDHGAEDA